MPTGTIKAKLRDKKDHYVFTLYKKNREKLGITSERVLRLIIDDNELIKIPTKSDFHITLPKKIIKEHCKEVKIKIAGIYNKENSLKRDKEIFINEFINLKSIIPIKNIFGKEIYVLEEGTDLYVWYMVGGGAKHIKIKKFVNAEKLAELMGFYFGDGNTSNNIRSFRINNCEVSTLNYCLDILAEIGINRNDFKVQVIYSTNKETISKDIQQRCISYWSKKLKMNKKKIVSVNKSKNKRESLRHGSARIFLDSAVLVEILLHGLLKKTIEIIENPKSPLEIKILKGFLRGLAAAEGSVSLSEYNSLRRFTLSFDPHSNEVGFYKRILNKLGIAPGKIHNNELQIQRIENFKILKEMDIFKMHEKRANRFSLGYSNHKFS